MNLYILRHGKAAKKGLPEFAHDADRPLTKKGRKEIAKIAEAMGDLDVAFDLILSSPFRRARETAEIVADVLKCSEILTFSSSLQADGDPQVLIEEMNGRHKRKKNVLLVGHEPYLSHLVSLLLSGHDLLLSVTLKKGGMCRLSTESLIFGKCATIEWLLEPDHFS